MAAAAGAWAAPAPVAGGKRLRAAVIGHTGRGNYGHGLDEVFMDHPAVEFVAIADADPAGLEKAAAKTRAPGRYLDFREMLRREKPELVSIAPRHTDQRYAMAMAALQAGAHLYCEKPFTTTLAEADELLALAGRSELRIAVAHQMSLAPQVLNLLSRLREGLVGEVVALEAHGKQDARAGGEDMIVLGTHLFDLMRHVTGDATSCQAWIREKGQTAEKAMARKATEAIGPVLGDEVEARFEFAGGVTGRFISRAKLKDSLGPWGLKILGTRGAVWVLMDIFPKVLWRSSMEQGARDRRELWVPLPGDPSASLAESERGFPAANRRVVDDWLAAIRERREPRCSGHHAMKAVEMAMAAYESALSGKPCRIPMSRREHPLV